MRSIQESIFFPGALGTYLSSLTPSPAIESFANKFIRDNGGILGTNAPIEPCFTTEGTADEEAIIVYELCDGTPFHIGIEKKEGEYPEAIIGVQA